MYRSGMPPVKARLLRRVRTRALPLLLALGALPSLNCRQHSPQDQSADAQICTGVIRRPRDPELVTLQGHALSDERLSCFGSALCFDGGEEGEALPIARGEHRVRAGGLERLHRANDALRMDRNTRIPGLALSGGVVLLASAEGVELLDPTNGTASRFPLPPLAPGERVKGALRVDDGYGYLVSREADPCRPAELRWLRRPALPEGLPASARLVVDDGALVGWLEPEGEGWTLVRPRAPSAAPGAAHPERLRVPVRAEDAPPVGVAGALLYARLEERAVLFDDQGRSRELSLPPGRHLLKAGERFFLLDEDEGLFRVTLSGDERVSSMKPGTDLAGAALPAGARRERVHVASDDERHLLFIERVRLPSCRAEDRVHLYDAEAGTWRTVATGDRVRIHPTFTPAGFRWVEGEPDYRFMGG